MKKIIKIFLIITLLFINKKTVYGEKTINDGIYVIKSNLNINKVIDIKGGNSYNKTNIQLYDNNNTNAQIWNIKYSSDGYYTILSTISQNKCLTVANNNFIPNSNIELYDCNNSDSQKFVINKTIDGYYNIITKRNNLYIDVNGAHTENATNIQIYNGNNTNAQKFILVEKKSEKIIDDGTYIINSALNYNKVIDLKSGNINNKTNIQLYDSNNTKAQFWNIKYLDDKYYKITSSLNENKCITISNNIFSINSNIELDECNNLDSQKFIIEKKDDNSYNIITKINYLNIDVEGAHTENGTNIKIYNSNNTNAQKFNFTKLREPKKTVNDGIYIIKSNLDINKVIDVKGANTANKTNIQLYEINYSKAQIWNITYLNDGYYQITSSLNENKCLTVSNDIFSINSNIELYDCNNLDSQKFIIDKLENGNYNIVTKINNLNIDIAGAHTENNTNIQLYINNNTNAQQFILNKIDKSEKIIDDGYYFISSTLNNNKVIDITNGNINNKTNIQLYDINYTKAQIWNIKYLNDGYYTFYSVLNQNKCLTVSNGKFLKDTNIELYDCNNTDSQKFIIYKLENDKYNIVSKYNNLNIDVSGANTENGTNIKLYTNNGTNAQQFTFKKYENKRIENGIYTIKASLDKSKVIDVSSGKSFENTNIQLYENNNTNAQKWFVTRTNDGYYTIRSGLNSNLYLSTNNDTNNSNVLISSKETLWELEYVGDDLFNIKLKGTNLYLNIENNNTNNGTNINILESTFNNSKKILFEKTEINKNNKTITEGNYIIKSKLNTNNVVDVSGAKKINNTNIQLYQFNNTNAQIWKLTYINDGYYTITSLLNIKTSIDLQGGNTNSGTNIQLYKYNGTEAQLWRLFDDGNGGISIVPKKSNNLCISVKDSKTDNGTNIEANTCNNINNQKFVLSKDTTKRTYKGIDVSQYQANINWEKVSNNIDFAVIRLGYGDNWTSQDDKKFERNVEECEKYNIPYAFYIYSYAKNVDGKTVLNTDSESATSEAEHTLRLLRKIKDKGYYSSMKTSIYIDMEEETTTYLGKDKLTKISDKFCNILENNGYGCGIYANKSWLSNYLNAKYLSNKYDIWIAEWIKSNSYTTALNSNPTYNTTNYKLWQFNAEGRIPGIIGDVDMDIGYNIFD